MVQKTGSGRSRDSLGTGRDAVRGRGRPPGPRRLAPGAPGTRRRHAKRPARRAWPGGSALATTAWPHYKVLFPSYWNESSRSLLRVRRNEMAAAACPARPKVRRTPALTAWQRSSRAPTPHASAEAVRKRESQPARCAHSEASSSHCSSLTHAAPTHPTARRCARLGV